MLRFALAKAITATESDLTPSLSGDSVCILIAADYVTLDLQGYAISGPGPGTSGTGIGTEANKTGVKVHSGAVTNFFRGIRLFGFGHTVEHINASDNLFDGILVVTPPLGAAGVNGHRIVGNTAIRNVHSFGTGITVGCPSVVLDNMATQNGANLPSTNIFTDGTTCTRLGNSPAP